MASLLTLKDVQVMGDSKGLTGGVGGGPAYLLTYPLRLALSSPVWDVRLGTEWRDLLFVWLRGFKLFAFLERPLLTEKERAQNTKGRADGASNPTPFCATTTSTLADIGVADRRAG